MLGLMLLAASALAGQTAPSFKLPPGFTAERVASPPLVRHPTMAGLDERGRLFVAESGGTNAKIDELIRTLPDRILVLEPDAQGRFTRGRNFADKMSFPMGALWHKGSLFVASPPSLWRLDEGPDGIAHRRTELVTKFGATGNAADVHGPFFSPDGRLYWADGRHGHDITLPEGRRLQGKAARIFRCKPDGSDVEVVCGGGMDNPVEIAFTDEGEPLFTCNIVRHQPTRQDGILYALEGAVYPWHDVLKEFTWTGDFLPMVENLGWVAPSGLMRYRGEVWGDDGRDVWFSTQFNRSRVMKHRLVREGGGFKMTSEEFLVSDDRNFHPTDVLEDADGSLLVIDTGGWFRIGCPTSKVAQPDLLGAIWRIRRENSAKVEDPRGLLIRWKDQAPDELADLLDDPRWPVRDRAIQELADRDAEALPVLAKALRRSASPRLVQNAIWAANRIESKEARKLVREMIRDKDRRVRSAAIHSAGLHRDAKAVSLLLDSLSGDAETVRQSATALGRIGDATASRPLFEALASPRDAFADHAIIHALLRLSDAETWTAYRRHLNPRLRRAALLVASQVPAAKLTRDDLLEAMKFSDTRLRGDAIRLLAERKETAGLADWMRAQLGEAANRTGNEREEYRELFGTVLSIPEVASRVPAIVGDAAVPARLLLLEAMERATAWSPAWDKSIAATLADGKDEATLRQIASIVRARNLTTHDRELLGIVGDASRSAETRIAAVAAMAPRVKDVSPATFELLTAELRADLPPLRRRATADILALLPLKDEQRQALVDAVAKAGPLELPALVAAVAADKNGAAGLRLLDALAKNAARTALAPATLEKAFAGFSKDLQAKAAALSAQLGADPVAQKTKLDALTSALVGGDPQRGRQVFFGPKAGCGSCHAIASQGGHIGPDLGKIASLRSGRDLLEAIVFPSNSFARGFEPIVVETKAGKLHTGILRRETSDALWLASADQHDLRLDRRDIAEVAPSKTSIMPQGLEAQLAPDEFRDLLAFVQTLR